MELTLRFEKDLFRISVLKITLFAHNIKLRRLRINMLQVSAQDIKKIRDFSSK